MKKSNIAIFLYSMASGGAERVVSHLLPYLSEKYQVTLVLMNQTINYEIPQKLPVVYLERSHADEPALLKLLKLPWLAWRYKKWLDSNGIDISFSFMNRPNYINALASLFGTSCKIIISERGAPSKQYEGSSPFALINRILIRVLYPQANHISVNSQGSLADLKYHFGITKPITVFYNPVDISSIALDRPKDLTHHKPIRCISIGRLDEGKNHKLQIDVLSRFTCNEIRLDILGEGRLESKLKKYIRNKKCEDIIFLQGRQEPFSWLHSSNIFLFSSRHEGFPNVLLEALACKMAIISTDCSNGPRELLAPNTEPMFRLKSGYELGEYGILVAVDDTDAFYDALLLLKNRSDLIETYCNKAIIRASQFDTSKTLIQYKKVIDEHIQ